MKLLLSQATRRALGYPHHSADKETVAQRVQGP